MVETAITYKVSVKQSEYTSMELEICSKFTHSDLSSKKTVTVTCNPPLHGKWIEIVASGSQYITLKVFEFERFGKFKTFYNLYIRLMITFLVLSVIQKFEDAILIKCTNMYVFMSVTTVQGLCGFYNIKHFYLILSQLKL